LSNKLVLSKAILPTTQKPGEATLKKCSLMAQKLQDQIVKLAKFVDPNCELGKSNSESALGDLVSTVAESLVSNTDIMLDKIERFKELKKKYNFKIQNKGQDSVNGKFDPTSLKSKADNSADRPFIPKITSKPHAKSPLPEVILKAIEDPEEFFAKHPNPASHEFPHPYLHEISSLSINHLHSNSPLLEQIGLERNLGSNFAYVETEDALYSMLNELKTQKLLAVDLEHHSDRSFLGYTCLMQLSTPVKDYIVDTIVLRDKLNMLNLSFADPNVLKVFHGSDSDIKWLQRDFGLYVVNMIDTYKLARRFNSSKSNSLASLLQYFNERLLQYFSG